MEVCRFTYTVKVLSCASAVRSPQFPVSFHYKLLKQPRRMKSSVSCRGIRSFTWVASRHLTLTCAESSWSHPAAWRGHWHTYSLWAGVEQSHSENRTYTSRHQTCWLHTWHLKANAHTVAVLPFRLLLIKKQKVTALQLDSSLTTSQQVLDQLLMATETGIISEEQEFTYFKLLG